MITKGQPFRTLFWVLALLATVFSFLTPSVAWSQIYTWVDEKGVTVYSNIRPADTSKLKHFKVAMEEEKPSPIPPAIAAQQAFLAAQADAIRRQRELENRVADLEQQLQMQQYQEQTVPADYYGNGSTYPSFGYPYGYGFSYVIPSRAIPPRIIASRRIVNRGPVFGAPTPRSISPRFSSPRGASFRGGGRGMGRR